MGAAPAVAPPAAGRPACCGCRVYRRCARPHAPLPLAEDIALNIQLCSMLLSEWEAPRRGHFSNSTPPAVGMVYAILTRVPTSERYP